MGKRHKIEQQMDVVSNRKLLPRALGTFRFPKKNNPATRRGGNTWFMHNNC